MMQRSEKADTSLIGASVCGARFLLLAGVWTIVPLMDSGPTLDILVQFYLNSTDCATEFSFCWLHTDPRADGGSTWVSGTKQNCGSLRRGRTRSSCPLSAVMTSRTLLLHRVLVSLVGVLGCDSTQSPCPLKLALCDTKSPTDLFSFHAVVIKDVTAEEVQEEK